MPFSFLQLEHENLQQQIHLPSTDADAKHTQFLAIFWILNKPADRKGSFTPRAAQRGAGQRVEERQ